jgi:hypothetical protein
MMLDYGRILTHSASLCWQQRRAIWPVLLLFSLSGLAVGLFNFWLAFDARLGGLADPDFVVELLLAAEPLSAGEFGRWAAPVLLTAFFYWLLITFAEGGLVGAVLSVQQEGAVDKTAVFRWGRRLLWRFLAIDAIIFIPPFLFLLLALLLPFGALLVTIWLQPQNTSPEMLALTLLLGTVGGCLLLCLALPLLPLTLLWRTLAMRETALRTPTIRAAIQQSLHVARRHPAEILILALLLWGTVLTTHLLLSAVTWPIFALLATLPVTMSAPLGLLLVVLRAVPQAIVQTCFIVAWTLGYIGIIEGNAELR